MSESPRLVAGQYRIEPGQPKVGGIGEVYRAYDVRWRRHVALKVARPDVVAKQPDIGERFSESAIQLQKLAHPNLVRVLDFGDAGPGHGPFLVMEWLEGPTFRELLEPGADGARPPHHELLGWLVAVCDGIAHLHSHGLVHRDLKPENVIVAAGVAKVIDFDLAKLDVGDRTRLTSVGVGGMGTPAYMAPEQTTDSTTVTPRADVFALGRMLHEALTNARPKLYGLPPRVSDLVPDVGDDLDAVVMACLAEEPSSRYEDAGELALALRACLAAQPLRLSPHAPATSEDMVSAYRAPKVLRRAAAERAARNHAGRTDSTGKLKSGASAGAAPAATSQSRSPDSGAPTRKIALSIGIVSLAVIGGVGIGTTMNCGTPPERAGSPRTTAARPGAAVVSEVAVNVHIPTAFRMASLVVRIDDVVLGTIDASADGDHIVTGRVGAGAHTIALARGDLLLALADHVDVDARHADVRLESPCPTEMVYVPSGFLAERTELTPPFCIDRREVTIGAFAAWCASAPDAARAGACRAARACTDDASPRWHRGDVSVVDARSQPCVAPADAMLYCAARAPRGRLPVDQEWLRAATAGLRVSWPWSAEGADSPAPALVASRAVLYPGSGDIYQSLERLALPPAEGQSAFGVLGLVGGLAEWTCGSQRDGDCRSPGARGGSFALSASEVMASSGLFTFDETSAPSDAIGMRCVVPADAPAPPVPAARAAR